VPAMFSEAFAELLCEKPFFPARLSIERQQDQNKSKKPAEQALRDCARKQRGEHPGVDGMADCSVGPAANQLMAGLDGDRTAPVAAERDARPKGKEQSENREDHAEQRKRGTFGNDSARQKISTGSWAEKQQKTQHRGNHMLEALPDRLLSFCGFARKRHQEPAQDPHQPGPARDAKRIVSIERAWRAPESNP